MQRGQVLGPHRGRPPRGFTLVELLVVVSISALLLGLVVPAFQHSFERQRMEGAAAALATDLQLLRSQALARNQALRLSLYTHDGGSCHVIHTGNRSDCRCSATGQAECSAGESALKTVHWPQAHQVSLSANVSSMLYDPAQGTATPSGSWRVTDSQGRGITHVVNILGRVRSCSPQGLVAGYRSC